METPPSRQSVPSDRPPPASTGRARHFLHPPTPTRLAASLILGLTTALTSIILLALLCDPPNTPATTSRTFIRDQRAWSVAESHRFGITRAWWSQLTRSDMTEPSKKSPRTRVRELLGFAAPDTEDPAKLIAEARAGSDAWILARPGGRVLQTSAAWGEFAGDDPLPAQTDLGCDVGYGWPFVAAWYQVRGQSRGNLALTEKLRHGHRFSGIPTARGDLRCRIIPLRPVWSGLAANTGIFAGAWLLAILIPTAVRRAMRRRRGRCYHCGYDLRATPPGSPCPECGRPNTSAR